MSHCASVSVFKRLIGFRRAFAVALCALTAFVASAQEVTIPAELQFTLLTRIIKRDRNLADHGDEIVIGVLYQDRYPTSQNVRDAFVGAAERSEIRAINDAPIRVVSMPFDGPGTLDSQIEAHEIDVLYISPLRGIATMDRITEATRRREVMTFTPVAEYVRLGIAVGVTARGNKPQILVNLDASRAEGVVFDARLLKLATVYSTLVQESNAESGWSRDQPTEESWARSRSIALTECLELQHPPFGETKPAVAVNPPVERVLTLPAQILRRWHGSRT